MRMFTNGVLGEGPWLSEYRVDATIDHPDKSTFLARFDLTDLWHDPTAREALASNGAIVLLDPATWDYAFAARKSPRLNLYRPPDPYVRAYRPANTNTHLTVTFAAPAPALAAIRPELPSDTLALDFSGLDPALDFTLFSSPSLLSTNWTPVAPADLSPLVLPASSGTLFYRLQAPEP